MNSEQSVTTKCWTVNENEKYAFLSLLICRLLFNDGEEWRNQRRFVLKVLKDFGFGRKSLEGVLVEEADRMADFFRFGLEMNI